MIYLFNFKTCGKKYTGKTMDNYRSRWNIYIPELRKIENVHM